MLGRLRHGAVSCDGFGSLTATLRTIRGADDASAPAAAVWSRGFAVPSHMPDPNEKWPEGRRAAEGERRWLNVSRRSRSVAHLDPTNIAHSSSS